jgi:PKD repeat protein
MGTGPITYEIIKPDNFSGTLNLVNGSINGQSYNLGFYKITINAKNIYGVDTKTLNITVLESVKITNTNLQISNKFGSQFSYAIESSGALPKTYSVVGIPAGITLIGNVMNGVFVSSGTYSMTLIVSGATTSDSKILNVVVGDIPVITSSGEISVDEYSEINYTITSSPISGVTYNVIGTLPKGLRFSVNTITGTSISTGIFNVTLKATNSFGTSTKELIITIYQTV